MTDVSAEAATIHTTGQRVRWLRERRGWKPGQLVIQAQMAAERHTPPRTFGRSTLYRCERDERDPETWTVIVLADALQTTTDFLLGRTNDPSPSTGGAWPVPAPDVAPLVDRLNALDPARRGSVTAALMALLASLTPDAQ
jgi:hypothetical protein